MDSRAVMINRMEQMGLGDLIEDFANLGWDTLGGFAFAAGAVQGNGGIDDALIVDRIIVPLFGADVRDRREPNVRRLHWEAFTKTLGNAQREALQPDHEEKPRIMPAPERAERLESIRYDLAGLQIDGDMEPSDTLVDKLCSMMEVTGVLKHVPLVDVGRRDHEILGEKKDISWKPDSSGVMRQHETGIDVKADYSTDLKLQRTLMRRGVAMHIAKLADYRSHDLIVRWLMKEYEREPLETHARVTLEQVLRADKEIFVRLAEVTRGGLGLDPETGKYVLDYWIPVILSEARIVNLMNPMPLAAGHRATTQQGGSKGVGKKRDAEIEDLKERLKRARQQQGSGGGKSSSSKGKGKGRKGKASNTHGSRVPNELIGLDPRTSQGDNICFDFNMRKGCSAGGGQCGNGKHVCMKCGDKNHGAASSQCGAKR